MTVTRDGVAELAGDSVRLLDDYRSGDFFFASQEYTLLGRDAARVVSETDPEVLPGRVRDALADTGLPVAAGVLPYDTTRGGSAPAHIAIPEQVNFSGPQHPLAAGLPSRALDEHLRVSPVPEPEGYMDGVARAVRGLRDGQLRKVVLARALQLTFPGIVAAERILSNLVKDNAHGYTFAADLPSRTPGHDRTLVGASPELLLSRSGSSVISHPLAGSAPRGTDPVTDRANARTLIESKKDHLEHALVIEAVADTLAPFCRNLSVPSEPSLTSTSTMWHLGTRIVGRLADRDACALTLATRLHPTPAICGTPRDLARSTIDQLEPFDRNYYAGIVGWCDAVGDGQWALAIRCADVEERGMRLYSGAGIVPDSQPELELAETSAKFQTLLRAMGLELEL